MNRAALTLASLAASLGACGSCGSCSDSKGDAPPLASAAAVSSATPAAAIAEILPRCRADGARAVIEGEDVVVGDAVVSPGGLLVGVVRRLHGKRVGSIVRTNVDLGDARIVDVGPSVGDDPPPSPRWKDGAPHAAFVFRKDHDAGAARGTRELRFAKIEETGLGPVAGVAMQQADESTAFDLSWPLVAWDEDARVPDGRFLPERGVVKVQLLPDGKPRVVSPDTSDAESPKLAPRAGGGFWVAWLAQRSEVEDAGWRIEGAGDLRAFRWVEVVALDAKGEPASPLRRIGSDRGHAVAFDMIASAQDLVVLVQDEAAPSEGAGARLVRHVVDGDRIGSSDILDAGVGHALVEVAMAEDAGWIAWKDDGDRAWVAPSTAAASLAGTPTAEIALDGARIIAASTPGLVYATSGNELRRYTCAR